MAQRVKKLTSLEKEDISELTKRARSAMHWTQKTLGEFCGCGGSLICLLEAEKTDQTALVLAVVTNIKKLSDGLSNGKVLAGRSLEELQKELGVTPAKSPQKPKEVAQQSLVLDNIVEAQELDLHGWPLVVYPLNEGYEVAMFSVCDFLGIKDTRQQAEKVIERGFGDLVAQRSIRLPKAVLHKVWMIHRRALMGWLFTIHPNNVDSDKREPLRALQRECQDVLDQYFFEVRSITPQPSVDTQIVEVLTRLAESNQRLNEQLVRTTTQTLTIVASSGKGVLTTYTPMGKGCFKNRFTQVLYVNQWNVIDRASRDPNVLRYLSYYGGSIEKINKTYASWIADLVIDDPIYLDRSDYGHNNKEAEHRIYTAEQVDRLILAFCGWIQLGQCLFQQQALTQNGHGGPKRYVPNIDDARKRLAAIAKEKGADYPASRIEEDIKLGLAHLNL